MLQFLIWTWQVDFYFVFLLGFIIYLYSITVWSAAPQTTLWVGPGTRVEPRDGPLGYTIYNIHSVLCWPYNMYAVFAPPLRDTVTAEARPGQSSPL